MMASTVDGPAFRISICCYGLLAAGLPISIGMAVTPWSPWGFEAFVTGIWVGLLAGALSSVPIGLGLRRQPRWWRRWMAGSFRALIAGWFVAFAVGLLYPLGLVPLRPSPLGSLASVGWTGLVFLIVLALPAWWLFRTLRDPYWRQSGGKAARHP